MKKILLFAMLLTLTSCFENETKAPEVAEPTPVSAPVVDEPTTVSAPVVVQPEEQFVLAWGKEHNDWTNILIKEAYELPDIEVKKPCKILSTKVCAIHLLSIMAKYESSFKPDTKFNETGHLQGVVSRGLLQISKDSANQSAYNCGITSAEQLHDPKINLQCGLKILAYQARKSGTLMDGAKGGCSAYWSVCRKDSKSYAKILAYLKSVDK